MLFCWRQQTFSSPSSSVKSWSWSQSFVSSSLPQSTNRTCGGLEVTCILAISIRHTVTCNIRATWTSVCRPSAPRLFVELLRGNLHVPRWRSVATWQHQTETPRSSVVQLPVWRFGDWNSSPQTCFVVIWAYLQVLDCGAKVSVCQLHVDTSIQYSVLWKPPWHDRPKLEFCQASSAVRQSLSMCVRGCAIQPNFDASFSFGEVVAHLMRSHSSQNRKLCFFSQGALIESGFYGWGFESGSPRT